jgi:N-methylhydantoinase A
VADADLVLGYINPDNFLGGRLKLDVELARQAISTHVAEPLGLSVEEAAEGIKTVIDARMADLIRTATIEQGYDPADFVLYAYGGAGPSHAFSYGAELRTTEIVVPLTASVHSAFGVATSDLTVAEELSHPMISPPGTQDYASALSADEINARLNSLADRTRERLAKAGADVSKLRTSRFVEMRFRFQIHVLSIPVPEGPLDDDGVRGLVSRFIESYEARFGKGSAFEAAGVELTTFRVVATVPTARPTLRPLPAETPEPGGGPTQRPVFQQGEWHDAQIYAHDAVRPGLQLNGLSIVEMPDTTVVVGPDQTAQVDEYGNFVISPAN